MNAVRCCPALTRALWAMASATHAGALEVIAGRACDWRKPRAVKCRAVTAQDAPSSAKCEFAPGDVFGLPLACHTRTVGARSEFIVPDSAARCQGRWRPGRPTASDRP